MKYSFKHYIEEFYNKDNNIIKLENILGIKLSNVLEYRTVSSKYIYKLLNIKKQLGHDMFQQIYLNYYRFKLTGDTLN